jgi:hypothetical protein
MLVLSYVLVASNFTEQGHILLLFVLVKMSTQLNGAVTPPALYTVEQLELIRRLRNSGISRDDVANAFDTFDRLDRELGPVYNIPVTLVSFNSNKPARIKKCYRKV